MSKLREPKNVHVMYICITR